jgi:hypothetical protein
VPSLTNQAAPLRWRVLQQPGHHVHPELDVHDRQFPRGDHKAGALPAQLPDVEAGVEAPTCLAQSEPTDLLAERPPARVAD